MKGFVEDQKKHLFNCFDSFQLEYEKIQYPEYNEDDIKIDFALHISGLISEYTYLSTHETLNIPENWKNRFPHIETISQKERVARIGEISTIFEDLVSNAYTDATIRAGLDNTIAEALASGCHMPISLSIWAYDYLFEKNLPRVKHNLDKDYKTHELISMFMYAMKNSGFTITKNKSGTQKTMAGSEVLVEWSRNKKFTLSSFESVEAIWAKSKYRNCHNECELLDVAISWSEKITLNLKMS